MFFHSRSRPLIFATTSVAGRDANQRNARMPVSCSERKTRFVEEKFEDLLRAAGEFLPGSKELGLRPMAPGDFT